MKRLFVLFCLIAVSAGVTSAQHDLQISLKNGSDKELQKKAQLERLVKQYNVSKWVFTKKVVIDEQTAIPHSHPVLTLNTGGLDEDLITLSTFVHEQIHWMASAKSEQTNKAIEELKTIYPDAPSGPPEGARNQYSTYLHLIVCHLEHEAMRQLAGGDKAKEVIETLSKRYYKWVYRTVLSDSAKIKAVVEKHGLKIG